MSDSTNKIVILILVVVVIFVLMGTLQLALFPYFPTSGMFHNLFDPIKNFLGVSYTSTSGVPMLRLVSFMSCLVLILWLIVVFWTYRDAERRGMNGLLWALLVLFGHFIGFLVYLLVRSGPKTVPGQTVPEALCPDCKKPVKIEFAVCPYCKRVLKPTCSSCGKDVKEDWQVCPYCKADLK